MSERVWWCEEHESPFNSGTDCRMVLRLLVDPDRALIVEKGEDGWPEWALPDGEIDRLVIIQYLDALKVAYDTQADSQ